MSWTTVDRALEPLHLVAVGGVDEDREPVLDGQGDLGPEDALLRVGLVVEADLADAHHAVLLEVAGEDLEDAVVHAVVVRLAGVQGHRAEVVDAPLLGAESLPAEDRVEVVDEGPDGVRFWPSQNAGSRTARMPQSAMRS